MPTDTNANPRPMDESGDAVLGLARDLKLARDLRSQGLPRGEILARLMEQRGLSEDDAFVIVAQLPDRPEDRPLEPKPPRQVDPEVARARRLGLRNIQVGGILLVGGLLFTAASHATAEQFGAPFLVARGALVLGAIGVLGGVIQYVKGSE